MHLQGGCLHPFRLEVSPLYFPSDIGLPLTMCYLSSQGTTQDIPWNKGGTFGQLRYLKVGVITSKLWCETSSCLSCVYPCHHSHITCLPLTHTLHTKQNSKTTWKNPPVTRNMLFHRQLCWTTLVFWRHITQLNVFRSTLAVLWNVIQRERNITILWRQPFWGMFFPNCQIPQPGLQATPL